MAGSDRWYFTKEQLENTPSRRCSIDADKELSYRQQAANFIQDMGQRLQVTQLCINTGIVYMHRFYMFHSFTKFHRNAIAACALFLAAKVEEQPRKLEHVIKVAHMCLHRDNPPLDVKSKAYQDQAHDLVTHENLMLQTLGFNIAVEHPHRFVVNCCQLVRASKDLAQTSYFMATNSLHLTTMCLQYKPTVVACVCIHLACKWSSWEIPTSSEGKDWFYYVDPTVTPELLEELTSEFLAILDKCPSRLKRKIISHNNNNNNNLLGPINSNINSIIKEEKISPNKQTPTKPSSSTLINEPSVSSSNLPQNVPLNVPTTLHVTTPTVTVTEPISRVKNVSNVNTPIMTETISKVKNFTPLTTSTSSSTTLAMPNINNSIMKPKNVVPNPNPTTSTVTTTSNFHNVSETSTFVKNVPTVQNVFSPNVNTSETISNVKNASNINTFTPITTVKNETITSAKNDHKVTSPNLTGTLANTFTTKTVPNVYTSNSNAFPPNSNAFASNSNAFASNSSAFASNSNAFASNSNIFASSSNVFASKSSNETTTNINNILNSLTSSYDNNEELMDFDTTESTSELSMSLFNMSNSIASNSIVKERRERPNLEMNKLDKHKETHYHHHHHHKNKHKEKHKKHKEKHKSKHKEKEKYGHSKDGDILKSSSKNISDHHNLVTKIPREKIKLRISKKQIDNNDKSSNNNGNNNDDAQNKGLKLVIKRS